ncbi:hypothetical protein HYU23_01160 [Candidatus Woesearchaeota archaeon]|nr:hypothetical protein [Candidatus Woesearchaeota archaeon]
MRFGIDSDKNYMKYRINNFLSTSNREIKDISKAWLAISIAFGIVLGGLTLKFFTAFVISAIAVGLGFLLHELSHKFFAQKYGYRAEFRSFDEMLFLAVIMSFFGFVIAAPGAVMIFSNVIDKRKNGIISVAGPIMNILLALLFLLLTFGFTGSLNNLNLHIGNILELNLGLAILSIGFLVNSWLALFNMIPFWLFDGAKVFRWNKIVYFTVVIISAFLVFFV